MHELVKKLWNSMIQGSTGDVGSPGRFLAAAIDEFTAICGEKLMQHGVSVIGEAARLVACNICGQSRLPVHAA